MYILYNNKFLSIHKYSLVKGNASSDSAGIIAAIADQVAKLELTSTCPIVTIQNDNR